MDSLHILIFLITCFNYLMSYKNYINSSNTIEDSIQETNAPTRVNVDVLKQRLIEEKRKEKIKRTIIFSSVVVSLGALTILTY